MDFLENNDSHILFIPGIFLDDCNDYNNFEIVQNNDFPFLQSELIEVEEKKYDTIPKYFIDSKSWLQRTNLLCCYCHDNISGIPIPIPLNRQKILITDNIGNDNPFVSLVENEYNEKDEHLVFNSQNNREVKVYKIHNIVGCDITCIGNYIRKVNDHFITNKREVLQMTLSVYKEITGHKIYDIPDKDLWIVMEQYSGSCGQTRAEYRNKNINYELKFTEALKNK